MSTGCMFIKSFNDVITNHALFSQLIRNTVVVFEFWGGGVWRGGGLPMEVFCLQGLSPGCDFLVNMCMYKWLLYNFHLAFWFLNKSLKSLNNKNQSPLWFFITSVIYNSKIRSKPILKKTTSNIFIPLLSTAYKK